MKKKKWNALFVTTIDLNFECGGTCYSKSVLNALLSLSDVQILILSDHRRTKNKIIRRVFSLAKSLLTGVPPNVLFHSDDLGSDVDHILKRDWDVVLIDHLESCYILEKLEEKTCVYVSQNRESQLIGNRLPRLAECVKNGLKKWVDRYESRISRRVQGILSISNLEAMWYREFCTNVAVVHPVFEVTPFTPSKLKSSDELRIGFLGSANWFPNAEAVEILTKRILPHTERKIRFILAGGNWPKEEIESEIERKATNGNVKVVVLGYVPGIQTFWHSIDLFVAPIVSGAGVNVKVCEALANGLAVLALPHAMRGLSDDVMSCEGVFLAHSNSEFAKILNDFEASDFPRPSPIEFSPAVAKQRLSDVLSSAIKF